MKTKALFVLLLLVLCNAPSSSAQDRRLLADRVLDSVSKHKKHWQLKVNQQVSSMELLGYDTLYLEWRINKSWLDAFIRIHATSEATKQTFSRKGPELGPTLGGGMRVLDTKIPNLGDENYMWEDIYLKGRQGIVFRKGNVFVIVDADSMDNAKKLAFYIAKEIPN